MTSDVIVPIDPMAPVVDGRYADPLVVVEAVHGDRGRKGERTIRTTHFDLTPVDGRVHVAHVVPATGVDDDLAGLLHEELFGPGWLHGPVRAGVHRDRPDQRRGRPGQLGALLPQHDAQA